MAEALFCGVDVGSSSVRVQLIDSVGRSLYSTSCAVAYRVCASDPRFVTQSSEEVWKGVMRCLDGANIVDSEASVSICVSATCSLVVKERVGGELRPYSCAKDSADPDQDVVFWMDTRSEAETMEMNETLRDDGCLKYLGGAFAQEMALTKAKYVVDHIAKDRLDSVVFFDLHDYLSLKISELFHCEPLVMVPDCSHGTTPSVGLDGELKGWSSELLKSIGLGCLARDNFSQIGKTVVQGVIDSYGSWIGSCCGNMKNTLTLVAGTSTCFMISHSMKAPTDGIWGPFSVVLKSLSVSTSGFPTTGKLIEHLFETHPAYDELKKLGNPFDTLESLISTEEDRTGQSIHYSAKNMFLYGELSGNRTPYGDAAMRGVFFGESTDVSLRDMMLKYVCILEFLAFQVKQLLSITGEFEISRILICGSQAKNKRLIELLAFITGLPIDVNDSIDPHLSGTRGAAYLAYSGASGLDLLEVIRRLSPDEAKRYTSNTADIRLRSLLDTKYEITMDIAKQQIRYRQMVQLACASN
ncbi:Mpa43p [Cyberlindnera jadinii NRRL Y-1542]|uniref:Actin-like ATPase domain-containing protein n=1 Tax=Cyberlindnera jadinii (strain ATCC 18201 / CBS 1600 / BCRC 20928 / JCM 3617 / NBRC 0987 / NRRL Y-1542) TaxID=983966 RepID=A0A1E4S417_CYBJN|nr:actin-like ATPase domain-containing protein [Cyberlindnera jadinii NRRL Y-1542]ODV74268.1 actin-like ATPase domain-containing protein [Cyberlindnera jadinii NRRL Y-1542]